ESMKIMGLPNWLHWTAWFVKCFMFLLISSVLMVIFLKVRWYTNTNFTVFTKADPFVLLLFLMFYNCATITFCFALSVLFNKANTAATIAGMVWFLSYSPYLFMANVYDTLTLTSKLVASIGSNTAMAFGFQVILMYEGTGEGIQWNNIFTPNTPDDSLTLGLILIMLTVDSIMYLLIALYIEALFPGEFGVPQPWYFPFTAQYWCGHPIYRGVEDFDNGAIQGEFFETEPENLKPGIQIRNLKKVFNQKVAVRNLSLNMYEDQITVLLGHNGAGKTTTMSMLTGMITPNGGTAKISGYDIRTDMEGVRKSLGLCPQHNIIFDELTVAEHIYFFSKLKGMRKGEIKSEIAKYVDLLELQEKYSPSFCVSSKFQRALLAAGSIPAVGSSSITTLELPQSVEDFDNGAIQGEFFETEPENLKPGIQIRNLKKVFNQKVAVRNLSLNMYEDQITVLLGHNGAGKTTTMSMLTGMITPNGGTAKISGYDIRTDMEGVRKSLGLCPQHNIIFDELTVAEHIYFFSKLKGMRKGEIKSEIAKYVDLLELQEKVCKICFLCFHQLRSSYLTATPGRRTNQMQGHNQLDVTANLKVNLRLHIFQTKSMLKRAVTNTSIEMDHEKERKTAEATNRIDMILGRTILLTTHFMDEADILGDRIAIMAGGQLQCCGSSFFLKKKYGAGYSLIMDKSQECDPRRVTQLLKKYIPDIEINSNVGSELTYLLVDDHVHVFEPMLRELETESEMLGIRSYGISLTTLEEVFMKVGADHGQEEMYNHEHGNIVQNGTAQNGFTNGINGTHKTNNGTHTMVPTYSNGFSLLLNQIIAMLLKKFVSTVRSWILLGIQVMMPTLFLIIAFVVARKNKMTGNLPAMPLSLSKFENPVTLVENGTSDYLPYYMKVLEDYGYPATIVDNITSVLLDKTEHHPILVTRRYQAAATFGESGIPDLPFNLPNLTAWFNNNPFHSPAVSLSLMLNSIYRKLGGCDDCTIEFTNSPLPYSAATQASQLLTVQNIGFQLSFNIGFSMSFVASFYVLFVIRENRCKSKHLQFVSGVKVYVFWLTAAFCDMLTYLFTVFVLMITMVMFQEDGFKSGSDISRMFFILFYFGWAFLPMFYLSSYFFQVPSTGYTRMTLVSIFGGNAAFLVVQVLQSPGLDLQYIGNALHWLFLIFPHYSLATGINESFKVYAYNNICANLLKTCEEQHIPKKTCISIMRNERIREICEDADLNYFKWKAPGIARNMVYSFLTGIILFALLLAIEYKIFSRVHYYLTQKHFTKKPIPVEDEDSDVSKERERIHVATEIDIKQNYTLAVKDLTKYYKNFLAVNGLCVGIRKFECFGLLGINGAGKTSTFMMMTGDTSISYGDAWVNGKSIKQHLEEVQKIIGYCPQFDALLDDMTAEESIIMFAMLRGLPFKDTFKLADYLSKEFDFTRHLKKKVKELSGGNKRKLSTAIALIGDPPLLYLDEPTTGMDPATKRHLWNALCKIRDRGKCIVLTSHSMEECEALCTRIAIMVNGNFKCLGSTQHLKHKFAEGYTLTIKLKKIAESSSEGLSETEPIEKFICQRFPGAQLRERHQELLNYYITNKSVPWSKMFGILEKGKRSDLNIEDYSLGQCSLEQVFLLFTKHENST
uniref:ATP-binding cassette sub-family A member 3-like n=1 Tax=Diabrotica virgifera virgifera TaxID=50390 RepID=A0A6P7GKL5_DIAVI